MLVMGFTLGIFIVPSLVGSFLILAVLAAFVHPLHFALTWFVLGFSAALLLCGSFWIILIAPFARSRFSSLQYRCHQTNPSQEKNNEAHHSRKVYFE
jgi:membrane protein YdbS with pleckstrin-like domain